MHGPYSHATLDAALLRQPTADRNMHGVSPLIFGIRFLRNHPDKVSWHGSGLQCSKAPPLLQVRHETPT